MFAAIQRHTQYLVAAFILLMVSPATQAKSANPLLPSPARFESVSQAPDSQLFDTQFVADAPNDIVVTSHTGTLDINQDDVTKSYYGYAEIKNVGSAPVKNIRVKTTAYFTGPAGLVSVGDSTDTPYIDFLAPGETSPLSYDVWHINFLLDVDQVRFTVMGDETGEMPSRPPVEADNVYLSEPGVALAVALSFAATNTGPCSVAAVKAVVTFYDSQGRILDADSHRLPQVLDVVAEGRATYPLLSSGSSFYYVAHARDVQRMDQVANYKIQFTGAETQDLPLNLQPSSIKFVGHGIDATISGAVSNPSHQTASQVFIAATAFDSQNHVIDTTNGEILTDDYLNPLSLGPGQARPFQLDGSMFDEIDALFDHGLVTTLASDTMPGPSCTP